MIIQAFSLICLCLIVLAVISTKALRRGRRIWATTAPVAPSPRRLFGRRIRQGEQARKSQPLILSVVGIVAAKIAVVLVLILILILVS
jgi:hypothetical protein